MTKKAKWLVGVAIAVVAVGGTVLFASNTQLYKGQLTLKGINSFKPTVSTNINVAKEMAVSKYIDVSTPAESLPESVVPAGPYECNSGDAIYDPSNDDKLYATYEDMLTAIDNGTLPRCETRLVMQTKDSMIASVENFPITNLKRENGADPDILISGQMGSDYPFTRVGLFPSGQASLTLMGKDYVTGFTYDRFAIYVK